MVMGDNRALKAQEEEQKKKKKKKRNQKSSTATKTNHLPVECFQQKSTKLSKFQTRNRI